MKSMTQYENIVESESCCAPGVRMILAAVWLSPEGEAVLFQYPVLALRSRSVLVFARTKRDATDTITPEVTSTAMLDMGWNLFERRDDVQAIINDSDYGLIGHDDPLLSDVNRESELVELAWPWDEARDAAAVKLANDRMASNLRKGRE